MRSFVLFRFVCFLNLDLTLKIREKRETDVLKRFSTENYEWMKEWNLFSLWLWLFCFFLFFWTYVFSLQQFLTNWEKIFGKRLRSFISWKNKNNSRIRNYENGETTHVALLPSFCIMSALFNKFYGQYFIRIFKKTWYI